MFTEEYQRSSSRSRSLAWLMPTRRKTSQARVAQEARDTKEARDATALLSELALALGCGLVGLCPTHQPPTGANKASEASVVKHKPE
jgi:hypothetical protein